MATDRWELILIHSELRRSHQRDQVGQHKALATHGNSEHKGVHRDESRPKPTTW